MGNETIINACGAAQGLLLSIALGFGYYASYWNAFAIGLVSLVASGLSLAMAKPDEALWFLVSLITMFIFVVVCFALAIFAQRSQTKTPSSRPRPLSYDLGEQSPRDDRQFRNSYHRTAA